MGEQQTGAVPARTSPRFGEAPLAQTVAAAGAIRRLSSLLLTLEHAHPTVDAILAQISDWERELSAAVPPDSAPRIGSDDDGRRRIYLDHATDIGAFNPCFPEYHFDQFDAETASGRVADSGSISVTLASGIKHATGFGHLSGASGSGTWHGAMCSGTWTAQRI